MSSPDLDERLREIVVGLTDQAPEPLPFPADRLLPNATGITADFSDEHQVFGPGRHRATVLMGVVAAAVLAVVLVLAVATESLDDIIFTDDLEQPQPEPVDESEQPGPEEADDAAAFDPGSELLWVRLTEAQTGGAGAERVPRDGRTGGLMSVTVGGPGFVAVGRSGQREALVWTSIDGATWTRVAHDHNLSSIMSITAGGPGLVAIGSRSEVWTSADGTSWSRLPHDPTFGDGGLTSVTAGGPGLVAVGGNTVWISIDGTSWTRVFADTSTLWGAEMESVTTGGRGLVAVGSASPGGLRNDKTRSSNVAAVWTSIDGTSWTRVPDEDVFADAIMWSVTKGGPGLVAVGATRDRRSIDVVDMQAVVWTSIDGTSWTRVPHNEDLFGKSTMRTVTAGGPGLVAVGYAWDSGSIAVWTSIDGTSWARLPHNEDLFGKGEVSSVAAAGPIVVAVGIRNNEPAIWLATPQG